MAFEQRKSYNKNEILNLWLGILLLISFKISMKSQDYVKFASSSSHKA